jgi:hypothetical protein
MGTPDQTIIHLSKKKIIWIGLGSCIFVAIGILMVSLDDASIRAMGRSPALIHGFGIAGVVFFSACGLYSFVKLFDRKPGLILGASGIVDNASGVSAGLIPWSEIVGGKVIRVRRVEILMIEVREPEKYLGRGNWLKQLAVKANYKVYGSPISRY